MTGIMSRRRINQQQTSRVKERQHRYLNSLEDTEQHPVQQGLVIAHYGKRVDVRADDGTLVPCRLRQNLGILVVGDRVVWQFDLKQHGVVIAVEPRRTLLAQQAERGETKALAANIDQIFVVVAPIPNPNSYLLDRYLVAAQALQIPVVIVMNKKDLYQDDKELRQHIKTFIKVYQQAGYDVIETSTQRAKSMSTLLKRAKDKVSVFVGQSGVGKSSLLSCLLPNEKIVCADNAYSMHGTHTTTTSRWYDLPQGGAVIDSPGVRYFSLRRIKPEQLANCFLEFQPYLSQCQFRNCRHLQEPNCAVTNAVQAGKINFDRWQNYQKLLMEALSSPSYGRGAPKD